MRKTWQYQVLTRFKAEFPKDMTFSKLVNQLFKKYFEGFYIHMPEASKKLKIKKCEQSEHFRYIKLYLIYYKKRTATEDTKNAVKTFCPLKYAL